MYGIVIFRHSLQMKPTHREVFHMMSYCRWISGWVGIGKHRFSDHLRAIYAIQTALKLLFIKL